jgi:hypothetical protein
MTGSGKTYTLLGESENQAGVAIMIFERLQDMLRVRSSKESGLKEGTVEYSIECSAMQVYMDKVLDLLSEGQGLLRLRTRVVAKSLTELGGEICEEHPSATKKICSSSDFSSILRIVKNNRKHACTHMNEVSSRSHCIITLVVKRHVQITGLGLKLERSCYSKLLLVDLAGNERDSARTGKPEEAQLRAQGINVNLSLAALGACLRHRAKAKSADETCLSGAGLYRASTLTRLLKEPLARAKIFFLACCSATASSAQATACTLTYAHMVKQIHTNAEDNAMLLEVGMDRFPVEYLPQSVLIDHSKIPRSSEKLTVFLHELRASVVCVMISHRWISPSKDPSQAHPDGPGNQKYKLICDLFLQLAEKEL